MLAAGSVLTAVEALAERPAASGGAWPWSARPAILTRNRSMGFCLFSSVATAAFERPPRRVAIVDIDAHHGNGTQDIFVEDPDVLFASIRNPPVPRLGSARRGAAAARGSDRP
ncbi:MAG: hypothetical protein R2695_06565 [Acidimicrobiales bacterium]